MNFDAPENHRYVEGQRIYLRECQPATLASLGIDNAELTQPVLHTVRPPFTEIRTPQPS